MTAVLKEERRGELMMRESLGRRRCGCDCVDN